MEIFYSANVYYEIERFDILSFKFMKYETVPYFLIAFYTKMMLFQGLLFFQKDNGLGIKISFSCLGKALVPGGKLYSNFDNYRCSAAYIFFLSLE